ncbi:ADP-ribosylation factor family-domain-containing protein [Mortierella sp. GBAus27b]|nr:ADP-ribosylation factor family-domain-containing protein [Mortierella sp. GBAus27b]
MGSALSSIQSFFFVSEVPTQTMMLGLDCAGKTTILYRLKLGEVVYTIPTIGFNVETFTYNKFTLTVWDACGGGQIARMWHHYLLNMVGMIFVVDSSDEPRIHEAREHLWSAHEELQRRELGSIPLLVYANKQDLDASMTVAEVRDGLGLEALKEREWHIQGVCALTGEGLKEGLDWYIAQVRERL